MRGEMKYYPRANMWKSSNVTFNPETFEGHSYGWWLFVAKIEGKVVFNNYGYSITTNRHQSKMRDLLDRLGIQIDVEVHAPEGLQDLKSAEFYIKGLVDRCRGKRDRARKETMREIWTRDVKTHEKALEFLKEVRS